MVYCSNLVFASNGDSGENLTATLFSYDEATVSNAMGNLDELESFLLSNKGITFNSLIATNNLLIANLEYNSNNTLGITTASGEPFGIPSILWGRVLGSIGMFIVYIMTDYSIGETKKSCRLSDSICTLGR